MVERAGLATSARLDRAHDLTEQERPPRRRHQPQRELSQAWILGPSAQVETHGHWKCLKDN